MNTGNTHALKHLAIIPDGNRRWSRTRGVSLERTYVDGCSKMLDLCKWLLHSTGTIEEVSLFFVSAENLRARRQHELDPLFSAGHHFLDLFYSQAEFSHIDLRWVGLHDNDFDVDSSNHAGFVSRIRDLDRVNHGTRRANVLFGYDVRRDIEAAMSTCREFRYENLSVTRPVDLIIRTGGQKRLSGFLPLVCQYSEFEFIDKLFPDVDVDDIAECIARFENSTRNLGV
jgi:undecaprenyl diphosphate synthase